MGRVELAYDLKHCSNAEYIARPSIVFLIPPPSDSLKAGTSGPGVDKTLLIWPDLVDTSVQNVNIKCD